jgi:hypothetical protein
MRIRWRAIEYERTCDDCGYVWRVPKEVAQPHLQDPESRGRVAGGGSGPAGLIWGTEAVLNANAALSERAEASRRCPKCESDHYKQRTIRS